MATFINSAESFLNKNFKATWVLGLGVGLATIYGFHRKKKATTPGLKKTVSYTTVGLAKGGFPPEANVGDPTMNAACYFQQGSCPHVRDIVEQIVKPLLEYERFSEVFDGQSSTFQPTRAFKPEELVREKVISGDDHAVHKIVFEHAQESLRRKDLPWWEILVLRNESKGPSACVVRVHHALGDGLGLIRAFESLITGADGSAIELLPMPQRTSKSPKSFIRVALSFFEATLSVLLLGMSKFDDVAFAKGPQTKHSGQRDFIIFPTVTLSFIKELKNAANVTVNDILMTAISQAIHDYCQKQPDPFAASSQCRALLTVGFPRSVPDKRTSMCNKWVLVSCEMGVGIDDILDRLMFVHSKTQELKEKPHALMQLLVQNIVAPRLPMSVGRKTVLDVFSRHSLVFTNIPGPAEKCLFAGQVVDNLQLFFENLLNQVDFMSYGGQVYGNIIYDSAAMPDFQDFGRYYGLALVRLAERLQVKAPTELLQ